MPTATASSFPPSIFLPPFSLLPLFRAPFLHPPLPSSCPLVLFLCPIFSVDQSSAWLRKRLRMSVPLQLFPQLSFRFNRVTDHLDGRLSIRKGPPAILLVPLLSPPHPPTTNFVHTSSEFSPPPPPPPPLLPISSVANDPSLPIPVFLTGIVHVYPRLCPLFIKNVKNNITEYYFCNI